MFQIIKSKGVIFFTKRVIDKFYASIRLFYKKRTDSNQSTFQNLLKTYNVYLLFRSEAIHYDLQDRDKIIALSEKIIQHQFNLLGSGFTELSYTSLHPGLEGYVYNHQLEVLSTRSLINDIINHSNRDFSYSISNKIIGNYNLIDWQKDIRTGFRWSNLTYYTDIVYGNNAGVDIKNVWELGRLNHLIILVYAYKISNEEKYLIEVINQIYDFTAFNPPKYGVQWSSAMDVALRVINLCILMSLIGTEIKNKIEDVSFINNYIYSHLIYLLDNLEWSSGSRGNHYFINIAGIVFSSIYLNDTEFSPTFLKFGLNEIQNEILYQFNEDGGNFEGSLPYHNFMSEVLFQTIAMINFNQDKISTLLKVSFDFRLLKKYSIHRDILERNKKLSDVKLYNDKKFKFSEEVEQRIGKISYFTYYSQINGKDFLIGDNDGGYFFRFIPVLNNDLSVETSNRSEMLKLLNYLYPNIDKRNFANFNETGYYFNHKYAYSIAVRCGKLGQNGKGGHAHNDQLSFELYFNDKLLVCDTGTYNYTGLPSERNHFRRTKMHNVLQIDTIEQNHINEEYQSLFWLLDNTNSKVLSCDDNHFIGQQNGYPKACIREIYFEEQRIKIVDKYDSNSDKTIRAHLPPFAEIIDISNHLIEIIVENFNYCIKLDEGVIQVENYDYSPEYGLKKSAKVVCLTSNDTIINWSIEFKT